MSRRATRLARRLAFGVTLIALCSASSGCGPPEAETDCVREGQIVEPDDVVQGHRAGDLVAPCFGTFNGQLNWSDGVVVAFTLDVIEQPEKPLQLSNVYQCRARNIGQYSTSHVATEDGALDHELTAMIHTAFPEAAYGAVPQSVVTLNWIEAEDWGEPLLGRLPVDASRYENATLQFEFDWPPESPPQGGRLMFQGTLVGTDLFDRIAVATLSF